MQPHLPNVSPPKDDQRAKWQTLAMIVLSLAFAVISLLDTRAVIPSFVHIMALLLAAGILFAVRQPWLSALAGFTLALNFVAAISTLGNLPIIKERLLLLLGLSFPRATDPGSSVTLLLLLVLCTLALATMAFPASGRQKVLFHLQPAQRLNTLIALAAGLSVPLLIGFFYWLML